MKITGYRGPYKDGFPTRFVMDDGTVWREASRAELAVVPDDTLVWLGRSGSDPRPAGEFSDLRFPGNYPFLAGMAALSAVFVIAGDVQ